MMLSRPMPKLWAVSLFLLTISLVIFMPGLGGWTNWAGAGGSALSTSEQSAESQDDDADTVKPAPAQSWNLEQGKLNARGNLAPNSMNGNLRLKQGGNDWLIDAGVRAGLLNDEFAYGLNLGGGWSPGGLWGLWLDLDGEFSEGQVEHLQSTLNLGYLINPDLRILATADYLSKTLGIDSWSKTRTHSQYGAGLSLDYSLMPGISLAMFYQHYYTDGKEYGQIGEYEYIDDDNWQHYGRIFAGVRGGGYDEAGLEAVYRHPGGSFEAGFTLSQIWRQYEAMLGYDSMRQQNGAGRLRVGWLNIMESGVNLSASISQEFSSQDRLSWQVGLNRKLGRAQVGLSYSEAQNDLSTVDRRVYTNLSIAVDSKDITDLADSAGRAVKDAVKRPRFKGGWLRTPVQGMGGSALKVSQQLERRIDDTVVDLDELAEGVTVSKNIMTISGLPALCCLDTENSSPSSAHDAFSVGLDGTSVLVDINKLPTPEYIQAVFKQQDDLYTVITFNTVEGSTKVTNQGKKANVDALFLQFIKTLSTKFKEDEMKFVGAVRGVVEEVFEGQLSDYTVVNFFNQYDQAIAAYWEISGQGTIVSGANKTTVSVKALKPGTYTITYHIFGFSGATNGYYSTGSFIIKVMQDNYDDDDGGGNDDTGGGNNDSGSGDTDSGNGDTDSGNGDTDNGSNSGSCGFLKTGRWTFVGLDLIIEFNNGNYPVKVTNLDGEATGAAISSYTAGCVDGKWTGNLECTMNGKQYSYTFSLNISNDLVSSGSTINVNVDAGEDVPYSVTGYRTDI